MLTISETAAEAIQAIVASNPIRSETAGVRISKDAEPDGFAELALALVEAPGPGDTRLEGVDEVPVFIEPDVADELDDQVLDADVDDRRFGFTLQKRRFARS